MKSRKTWYVAACIVLLFSLAVFGTLAYLTDKTETVVNTFTVGMLLEDPENFVLREHKATDTDQDGVYVLDYDIEVTENAYTVVPGVELVKDPFVETKETLKLDAYVFIEVVDETGTSLTVTVDSSKWTEMSGVTGSHGGKVYVMAANGGIAEAGETLGPISILAGNKIPVDNAEITDADAQFGGSVSFYGYMIQAGGFDDYEAAWAGFDTPAAG